MSTLEPRSSKIKRVVAVLILVLVIYSGLSAYDPVKFPRPIYMPRPHSYVVHLPDPGCASTSRQTIFWQRKGVLWTKSPGLISLGCQVH